MERLKIPVVAPQNKELPNYAMPTAANALVQEFRGYDLATVDLAHNKMEALHILEAHKEAIYAQRKAQNSTKMKRRPQKQVTSNHNAEDKGKTDGNGLPNKNVNCFVKKINIKKIDYESIANLKNKMSGSKVEAASIPNERDEPSKNLEAVNLSKLSSSDNGPRKNVLLVQQSIDDVFIQYLQLCKEKMSLSESFDGNKHEDWQKQWFHWLIQHEQEGKTAIIIQLFEHLTKASVEDGLLVKAAFSHPKQMWRLMSVLSKGVETFKIDSCTLRCWLAFGDSIFLKMREQRSNSKSSPKNVATGTDGSSYDMLHEFGLQCFADIIRSHYKKRVLVMKWWSHLLTMELVRYLHQLSGDVELFTMLICVLLTNQKADQEQIQEDVIECCLYYAINGLSTACVNVRTASVAILAHLTLLPQFQKKEAMDCICNGNNDDCLVTEGIYSIIEMLWSSQTHSTCANVNKVGIHCLSEVLEHHPKIWQCYANKLLQHEKLRNQVISNSFKNELVDFVSVGVQYPFDGEEEILGIKCKGWIIWYCILEDLKKNELGNLLKSHMILLQKTVDKPEKIQSKDFNQWSSVFMKLTNYFFVELCDPNSCQIAVEIMSRFFFTSNVKENFISLMEWNENTNIVPPLFGVLQLLFPNGDLSCQQHFHRFICDLLHDPFWEQYTKTILNNFYQKSPIAFAQTILANLMTFILK
ncbi:hypothetical protein RFI_09881 [Reticulomyxa filosa]|uniref:Uncharacterized protein n=1 Tax=Reticulomyxa filosa TaxID=46433 RepID=X6NPE8_RETFI|nr:hypothetical protein RFI_09881 [Reticulomyxa filosa]|eukprot:ETO27252.1 hypothetical protein RFI_09881 [Reticulomyxa filosa]